MPMSRTRARRTFFGGQNLGNYGYPIQSTHYNVPKFAFPYLCMDELHKGPPYRSGGPLFIQKQWVKIDTTDSNDSFYGSLPQAHYTGAFYTPPYFPSAMPSESSLSGWGARGWARTMPVRPIYQFGVSLAELRDIPRMLNSTSRFLKSLGTMRFFNGKKTIGEFLRDLRLYGKDGLGSDYLNLQFGWVPFMSDLAHAISIGHDLPKRLRQLKRDNGKPIRRSAKLKDEQSDTMIESQSGSGYTLSPTLSSYLYGSPSYQSRATNRSYRRNIWFTASYTYWIPELHDPNDNSWENFHLKRKLLGLQLSPDVIFRSLPWTWLIDWFTNTGDIISNMTNMQQYHVVARYAYVMAEESYTWTRVGSQRIKTGYWKSGQTPAQHTQWAVSKSGIVWKRREEANPYGFGLSDGALSAYQWSILVALGLTRFR